MGCGCTRIVMPLAQKLEEELRSMGRMEWFEQSCEKAIASAAATRVKDVENAWRISGSSDLQGRAAAVLRALWNWRDAEARASDRPPFHILHNEQLIACARGYDSAALFLFIQQIETQPAIFQLSTSALRITRPHTISQK